MRHNFLRRILGGILTGCILVTATVHAGTTQKDIDKAKDQITDLKKQKEDAKDQVDSLTNEKQGLESDLSGLNGQLNTITSDMNQLEQQAAQKEDEINTAAEDLKRSEERSAEQYEDMKVRIQYIYENGNQSVWDMLIHVSSIAEFLNQAEYTSAINQYDRNMLTAYQELTEQIKKQKKELEEQKEELTVLQQEKQKEQEKVNSLIEDTQKKIQESSEKIEDAQSDVESIDAKIEKMIEYEKQLEIQKAKEDAARLAAIKKQEQENRSNVTYAPAQSDAYLLAAIIQCEAWGEPYDGKLAVGSVISGKSLADFICQEITRPLGMVDTGYLLTPEQRTRVATIYDHFDPDYVKPYDLEAEARDRLLSVPTKEFEICSSSLYSTLDDYSRFIQMLANGGSLDGVRVLGRKTVELMASDQLTAGQYADFKRDWFPNGNMTWGLLTCVSKSMNHSDMVRFPGAFGWSGAAGAVAWADPGGNLSITFMTQRFPGDTEPIVSKLMQIAYSMI